MKKESRVFAWLSVLKCLESDQCVTTTVVPTETRW
jgi:hypothetical protein